MVNNDVEPPRGFHLFCWLWQTCSTNSRPFVAYDHVPWNTSVGEIIDAGRGRAAPRSHQKWVSKKYVVQITSFWYPISKGSLKKDFGHRETFEKSVKLIFQLKSYILIRNDKSSEKINAYWWVFSLKRSLLVLLEVLTSWNLTTILNKAVQFLTDNSSYNEKIQAIFQKGKQSIPSN